MLSVASTLDPVREGRTEECSAIFVRLLQENERYANIGAADEDGNIVCSGVPIDGTVNIADRSYFKDAMRTKRFVIGEYQIGRITRKPSVNLALPIAGPRDGGAVVLFAALDITFLESLPLEVQFPVGSALTVIDRKGTILVRHPDPERWRGSRPEAPIIRSALQQRSGSTQARGLDGVERLYSFRPLAGDGALVAVGVRVSEISGPASRALVVNIIGLLIIGTLAMLAAWVLGNRFVVRPVSDALALEQAATKREREAAESLRVSDDMKNTFLTAVGHDLRNPVAAIKGFAYILQTAHDRIEPEERMKMLGAIENASERLERLLDSLLDLERLQRGLLEPVRSTFPVLRTARRVVADIDIRDHEVAIEGEDFTANLDATEYERIIDNLVRNAVKYTRPGAPVTLRVERAPGGVQIDVEDRGPGVPDAMKTEIFEVFRRGATGGASGMGIGLYLVARFAELHGGRAWVEDRPGGGARFRVFLGDEG
ncbi:MAG TPA: sensor histidine kinase [Actinomycetota bacterium]|nr:sensor histidine kinase [Actinomycetota bacterium]